MNSYYSKSKSLVNSNSLFFLTNLAVKRQGPWDCDIGRRDGPVIFKKGFGMC